MEAVIPWCAFVGSWLLFAGPIFQAAIELEEVGIERDELSAQLESVQPPPRPSPWWWLLPPVGYILQRRRTAEVRRQMMATMTRSQLERMVSFSNTATGWLFVAGGAFFIALKETWELAEHDHWPLGVYVGVVLAMFTLGTMHTIVRLRGTHRMLAQPETPES